MKNLDLIIEEGIKGHYTDEYFHLCYPNFSSMWKNELSGLSTDQLIHLHQELRTKISDYCHKKFSSRYSIPFVKAEFNDPKFPNQQSPFRKFIHSLYANLAVEIDVRQHYDFLVNLKIENVSFYEKKNWGKCILFSWKGKILMASGEDYYYHNPTEYSLYSAKPKLKNKYHSQY